MPRRKARKKHIVMTQQQAEGFFGDLAKKALKAAAPIIKKEGKKLAKKALQKGVTVARKKAKKKFGFGLKLAGQGPRGKQRRRRKRRPGVRVIMI